MTQREEDHQDAAAEEEDDETEEELNEVTSRDWRALLDSKRNTAGNSKCDKARHHVLHRVESKTRR